MEPVYMNMGKIPDVRVDNLDEVTRNTPIAPSDKPANVSKNAIFRISNGLSWAKLRGSYAPVW